MSQNDEIARMDAETRQAVSGTRQHVPFDLDDLRQLAHTHPLVHAALTAYDYGEVPLERVLLGLAVALCQQLRATEDQLSRITREGLPSIVLQVPEGRIDALLEVWKR